ncbi:hypothetical protein PPSIR1_36507 [Plesiocystis pacifica SIR-1]|uniref:Uncharacterized protein n=1 Tax=Plesiocystis pacifica SIR-1 TaxID=391625 RepID=A6G1K6_9BACT|nr:hypothetical protein [Plesiocystis pacifica]EDM80270.1 hypothetical protein PPSIR1_36507 [Plesiocystis pacifica SIR-1]
MGTLLPLLATFLALSFTAGLVATVGRRRRRRDRGTRRALAPAKLEALALVVGEDLIELIRASAELRVRLEDALAGGRQMLAVEEQLSGVHRRPLWRQIEDANYGHALGGVRSAVDAWLARVDGLGVSERQILDFTRLSEAPLRALAEVLVELGGSAEAEEVQLGVLAGDAVQVVGDRRESIAEMIASLEAAIACLVRFESELSSYRPQGYR